MRKKIIYILLILQSVISCKIGPTPIQYGSDNCDYCSMTIVDNQHAAELVTNKGKIYKFDAIECMIHYELETNHKFKIHLITDYSNPGNFTNALDASYLISDNIRSPMGANLSGFEKFDSATVVKKKFDGIIYTYEQLKRITFNK